MARQLNANCNFKTGYLICDIPDNTMEVVVKIKTMFGKLRTGRGGLSTTGHRESATSLTLGWRQQKE